MFWREGVAWVMLRCPSGQVVSLPWRWTNLPVPAIQGETAAPASDAALLSPAALLGLVRHLHSRPDATISAHAPLGGPLEVRQPGAKGDNTAFRSMLERALATGPTPWALQIERVLPDLAPWDLEDYPGVRDLL